MINQYHHNQPIQVPLSTTMPSHVKPAGTSLKQLGFKQCLKGLSLAQSYLFRSKPCYKCESTWIHWRGPPHYIHVNLDAMEAANFTEDFQMTEPTPHKRYCVYLKIKNYGLREPVVYSFRFSAAMTQWPHPPVTGVHRGIVVRWQTPCAWIRGINHYQPFYTIINHYHRNRHRPLST